MNQSWATDNAFAASRTTASPTDTTDVAASTGPWPPTSAATSAESASAGIDTDQIRAARCLAYSPRVSPGRLLACAMTKPDSTKNTTTASWPGHGKFRDGNSTGQTWLSTTTTAAPNRTTSR